MVIDGSGLDRGMCWTHGNFVARRKLSGCLSFPPAPPTLFFFELTREKNINKVVTCTPLGMYLLDLILFCLCKSMNFKRAWHFHQKTCHRVEKATAICLRFTLAYRILRYSNLLPRTYLPGEILNSDFKNILKI
jgi:hypothetical protein